MFFRHRLAVHPACTADRNALKDLIRRSPHVHSHLDWKLVEDWLDHRPFLLAKRGRRMVAALACPPDPPDTAWIRLFAVSERESPEELWNMLWPLARRELVDLRVRQAAALSLEGWTAPLYQAAGFGHTYDVVVLIRRGGPLPPRPAVPAVIHSARPSDFDAIAATDTAAFLPPWQNSPELIRTAIEQADYVGVAEAEGHIVGYQLTTPGREGAHLARLAVRPQWQGRGIGRALVADLIHHYHQQGIQHLTVNTQAENSASLEIYHRLGFQISDTRFPVYQLVLG